MPGRMRTCPCPSDGSLVHFYPQTVPSQLYVQTLGRAEAGQLQAHVVVPPEGACPVSYTHLTLPTNREV